MKAFLYAATAASLIMAAPVNAETIGVTISKFDDNFLTVLRNGMTEHASSLKNVSLQLEDAQGDNARQLNQIQNFIASTELYSVGCRCYYCQCRGYRRYIGHVKCR